ncbi:MAG TPA: hypothetical protein VE955_03780 [Candidatus Dormibacteraeota bacterium]|nr:hypothetical protein [Candidatus Dormibacteraeota bacterium]
MGHVMGAHSANFRYDGRQDHPPSRDQHHRSSGSFPSHYDGNNAQKRRPFNHTQFYVALGEFYTTGAKGVLCNHAFDGAKLLTGIPDYVVFNGRVGSLIGNGALHPK